MKINRSISLGIDGRVLFRKNIRGMGRYLKNIILEAPQEYQITIYGEKEFEKDFDFSTFSKQKIKTFNFKGYRYQLWEQIGLPFFMLKERHNLFFSPATTAPILHPCKLIVTVHDARIWIEKEKNLLRFYYDKIVPKALKKAHKIVTISNYSKKEILNLFPDLDEKIVVIYHGVDKIFRPDYKFKPEILPFYLKKPFLLYIGGDSPKKQPLLAVEIFKEIKKELHEFCLVMIGFSEQESHTRKSIENTTDIIISPPLKDEQLAMLYAHAEVVLYPTLHEGFGFPVLEAMRSKTPILASNVASIPEISQNYAFLIEPKDKKQWIKTLLEILKNKNSFFLKKRLNKAYSYSLRFSWENAIQKTYKLFDEVIYDS